MRGTPPLLILALLALGTAALGAAEAKTSTTASAAGAGAKTAPGASQLIVLAAPLTTMVPCPGPVPAGGGTLRAIIEVPVDAPADLGVGAYIADRHGRWFQRARPGALGPGRHVLEFALGGDAALLGEPAPTAWTPSDAALAAQAGLYLWSASASRCAVRVTGLAMSTAPAAPALPRSGRLTGLELGDFAAATGSAHARTGERWALSVLPEPFPANPYDPAEFALDAVFTAPDGKEQRVPGFARAPILLRDRGDREDAVPQGPTTFAVRFRARTPGTWHLRLEARWGAGPTVTSQLPDLDVAGEPWDGYARVDHDDPRFFAVGGAFTWPIGLNLNSAYDLRSRDRLATKLTPARGTLAYLPRMARFAAAGGDLVEIWMSSWNLALEWRADWPGFAGAGRYNQANAERLDRILDEAWRLGMRVNLVINNHGQASPQADREWKDNPLNTVNGGPLSEPLEVFSDPRALAYQERLRRYLVARYADHPAVFGWKLWSEVNLTAAGDMHRQGGDGKDGERRETLLRWHETAAARWHALDGYGHGVTTHWAGDYRRPDRAIVALPGIDYVCIDAYHGQNHPPAAGPTGQLAPPNPGELIINLLWQSTQDASSGLARFNKPLVVTEYGASSQGGPPAQMLAESASGNWAALVSGHGAAPMLWWFEWVDQGEHWQPYRAIARFLKGEDLRGAQAHSVVLAATSAQGELWARAWARPGRMLGYVADSQWAFSGAGAALHPQATVQIGAQVAAGECLVQWWNADSGEVLATEDITHPGGALILTAPAFARHLAFKLERDVPASP